MTPSTFPAIQFTIWHVFMQKRVALRVGYFVTLLRQLRMMIGSNRGEPQLKEPQVQIVHEAFAAQIKAATDHSRSQAPGIPDDLTIIRAHNAAKDKTAKNMDRFHARFFSLTGASLS